MSEYNITKVHFRDIYGALLWSEPMRFRRLYSVGGELVVNYVGYTVRRVAVADNIQHVNIERKMSEKYLAYTRTRIAGRSRSQSIENGGDMSTHQNSLNLKQMSNMAADARRIPNFVADVLINGDHVVLDCRGTIHDNKVFRVNDGFRARFAGYCNSNRIQVRNKSVFSWESMLLY